MNPSEGETQSFSDSHHENIIFATFYILMFLIAEPGNALALWAFFPSHESLGRANRITSALTCVSGVLDPVMYFFLNRVYRDTLLQLFCEP
ncbi:hypothetical protein CgunFtcFv8_015256 [Champsocephalus gunnari]|uniref:G-protein coupled receptors family 1 profile domain-containing protein n=1 Tax=Champsocephalus gunnari TaxID=52237 RepID=A0AAN8C6A7_CHAGU|nr:hypothetical protein CgunFtcFv8_015256 [Champsocephalus gunnari]